MMENETRDPDIIEEFKHAQENYGCRGTLALSFLIVLGRMVPERIGEFIFYKIGGEDFKLKIQKDFEGAISEIWDELPF